MRISEPQFIRTPEMKIWVVEADGGVAGANDLLERLNFRRKGNVTHAFFYPDPEDPNGTGRYVAGATSTPSGEVPRRVTESGLEVVEYDMPEGLLWAFARIEDSVGCLRGSKSKRLSREEVTKAVIQATERVEDKIDELGGGYEVDRQRPFCEVYGYEQLIPDREPPSSRVRELGIIATMVPVIHH